MISVEYHEIPETGPVRIPVDPRRYNVFYPSSVFWDTWHGVSTEKKGVELEVCDETPVDILDDRIRQSVFLLEITRKNGTLAVYHSRERKGCVRVGALFYGVPLVFLPRGNHKHLHCVGLWGSYVPRSQL